MNEIPNQTKLGTIDLIKNTTTLFRQNIATILQLFGLFIIFTAAFTLINEIFFKEISTAITNKNLYDSLKGFSLQTKIIYGLFALIFGLSSYLFYFPIVKIIAGQSADVFQAFRHIANKIIPITLTTLLIAVIFGVIGMDIVLIAKILGIYQVNNSLLATITITSIYVALFIFCVAFIIRTCLFAYPTILEDKFYFRAIAGSLKFTKGHVLSILWQSILITTLALLADLFLSAIFNPIIHFIIPGSDGKFEKQILGTIYGFLPSQFLTIAYYLIYKFYRSDAPENFSLSKKQKIFFAAIILPSLLLLVAILFNILRN